MLVHVLTRPRTIILEAEGYVLRFRPSPSSQPLADFLPLAECADLANNGQRQFGKREMDSREVLGCLGMLRMKQVTYLICCCTGDYAGPSDMMAEGPGSESVYRVGEVLFFALEEGEVGAVSTHPGSLCHDVHEVLADGHLYYSGSPWFDLTSRLSKRLADARHHSAACTPTPRRAASPPTSPPFRVADLPTDPRLLFNLVLLDPLHAFRNALSPREKTLFDARGFSVPVIQGFYGAKVVDLGEGVKGTLMVCSRRGRRRAGTRFSKRGIDERGDVANFAETETMLFTPTRCFSFVQVRGSVPLFWQEKGILGAKPTIHISNPLDNSIRAFRWHCYALLDAYGPIHILNLLSQGRVGKHSPEAQLRASYASVCKAACQYEEELAEGVEYGAVDVSALRAKLGGQAQIAAILKEHMSKTLRDVGATIVDVVQELRLGEVLQEQKGVVRSNCRAQSVISEAALDDFLTAQGHDVSFGASVETAHRLLWSQNGDALAEIYAGSGALNAEFVRYGVENADNKASNVHKAQLRIEQYRLRDPAKERATELLTGEAKDFEPVVLRRAS